MRGTSPLLKLGAVAALAVGALAASTSAWGVTRTAPAASQSRRYTLTDPAKGPGDSFGQTVATSAAGTTVLVGAYGSAGGNGVAYVYTSAHHATPVATLTDPGAGGDHFGFAVALSPNGTTAYVGADRASAGTRSEAGAVYVYRSSGGKWPAHPTSTIEDPGTTSDDFFGAALAISPDGSALLVGAPGFTVAATAQVGRGYVYAASHGTFPKSPSATLKCPLSTRSLYGYSVAISKDAGGKGTAIVGAYVSSVRSATFAGNAYVYDQRSAHAWALAPQGALSDPQATSEDFFGHVVAINGAGTVVLVGAQDETEKSVTDAGAVFTYVLRSGHWKLGQTLDGPADGAANFSSPSISANGAVAVMGAPNEQVGTNSYAGEAFVYDAHGTTLRLASSIPDPTGGSPAGQEYFGAPSAESANGDTSVIGAPATTGSGGNPGPGVAYVYNVTP